MKLYVVALAPENSKMVEEKISDEDRCEIQSGVWFVRSSKTSSGDVAKQVGIGGGVYGTVVTADFYWGYARSDVVETLKRWASSDD